MTIRNLWPPWGKTIEPEDFHALWGFIGAYLHLDMDLEAGSVPEAISNYARIANSAAKAQIGS